MRRPGRAVLLAAWLSAPVVSPALAAESTQAGDPSYQAARRALDARIDGAPVRERPRNVILFIADGMGPAMVTAIRLAAGQAAGGTGDEHVLSFEAFPHLALVKTWNTDAQTPDSAGASTAIMSGLKTRKGVIGVGPGAVRGDCASALAHPVATLGELAEAKGLATGIITTARLTHATPAAFYAHAADRNWEDDTAVPAGAPCIDIARQLLAFPFEVAMGGGREHFLPAASIGIERSPGRRGDGHDLIAQWQGVSPGRMVAQTDAELAAAIEAGPGQLLGLFNPAYMRFGADRATDPGGEPSLSAMTEAAITLLSLHSQGYLLLVEGGLIDPALHIRDLPRALIEGMEFDSAVASAVRMTDPAETLILVTSDHDHRMPPWAQTPRGASVGGLDTWRAEDNPVDPHGGASFLARLGIYLRALFGVRREPQVLGDGSHTPGDVAVYARGPMAYLVNGTVEQTYLFHLIALALSLNPNG